MSEIRAERCRCWWAPTRWKIRDDDEMTMRCRRWCWASSERWWQSRDSRERDALKMTWWARQRCMTTLLSDMPRCWVIMCRYASARRRDENMPQHLWCKKRYAEMRWCHDVKMVTMIKMRALWAKIIELERWASDARWVTMTCAWWWAMSDGDDCWARHVDDATEIRASDIERERCDDADDADAMPRRVDELTLRRRYVETQRVDATPKKRHCFDAAMPTCRRATRRCLPESRCHDNRCLCCYAMPMPYDEQRHCHFIINMMPPICHWHVTRATLRWATLLFTPRQDYEYDIIV